MHLCSSSAVQLGLIYKSKVFQDLNDSKISFFLQ